MSVAALKGDPSQLAATARAIDPRDHAGRQLAAFYAAGAAYRDGLPISACPFDLVGEADLRAALREFAGRGRRFGAGALYFAPAGPGDGRRSER